MKKHGDGEEIGQVVSGTVEFIWDSGDDERHMLLNIEPELVGAPSTFEIEGDLRDEAVSTLNEGDRVEISYRAVEQEVVDPETGMPSESCRADVTAVRVLG